MIIDGVTLTQCQMDTPVDLTRGSRYYLTPAYDAVFRAVVVSRLTYASPAWNGFITATDRQRAMRLCVEVGEWLLPAWPTRIRWAAGEE